MKERKLDMFAVFRAIDSGDGDWLTQQSDEARKEFAPLVAMRWATGVSDGMEAVYTLWLINQRVNCHLFDLPQEDADLSFRLLISCGIGRRLQRHWLPSRRGTSGNAAEQLLADYHPTASREELRMLMSLYNRDDFVEFVNESGKAKDEVKACLHAYDKANND